MSGTTAALLTFGIFGIIGLIPTLALVGPGAPLLVLAPLVTGVETSLAGACSLAFGGTTYMWFWTLSILAASIGGFTLWRKWHNAWPNGDSRSREKIRYLPAIAFLLLVGTGALCLVPLRVPAVGWDSRAIWILRASWFAGSGHFLRAVFQSPGSVIAHPSYPPLISSSVAVAWRISGTTSDAIGVALIAMFGAAATVATAWVLMTIAGTSGGGQANRRHGLIPYCAATACAVCFVFVVFGIFGPFATNGYADPLWSVAAAGAIGYGLVLPMDKKSVGAACILLAVSGLTKDEGAATAAGLILLIVARTIVESSRSSASFLPSETRKDRFLSALRAPRGVQTILLGLSGLLFLGAWPLLASLEHAPRNPNTSGLRQGDWILRIRETAAGTTQHLHVLFLAIPIAVFAAWRFRRTRARLGIGSDLWSWLGLGMGLLVITAAYVTGPGNTAFWLASSVHRTTMFPAIVGSFIIAVWVIVAIRASNHHDAS